ncbi:MAG TPA: NAD-dependent epimerase/dehydratase family protein [Spirochaetia bacterium]|nr:NAD-dependent epimerase/dehydratase family protein [Spirochaetia bacterium]
MKVVVIGGSGHIGTYLVPRLVEGGHEVTNVTRGLREPYQPHDAWKRVRLIRIDRQKEEAGRRFGESIKALEPDVVMDLICFKPESARPLVEALRGQIRHYICCGTTWIHGPSVLVPTREEECRNPFGEYGIQKAALENYLLEEAQAKGFPATLLHPGHIVGKGWLPISPVGNRDPLIFSRLAKGEEVEMPNLGMEILHHVHADDVAQAFVKAMSFWGNAVGESFHVVSPQALTMRGYAETVASWFGREARLKFVPFEQWRKGVDPEQADMTWDHIARSPNYSIAKARRLLDYQPRYGSLQAIHESITWLMEKGLLAVDG